MVRPAANTRASTISPTATSLTPPPWPRKRWPAATTSTVVDTRWLRYPAVSHQCSGPAQRPRCGHRRQPAQVRLHQQLCDGGSSARGHVATEDQVSDLPVPGGDRGSGAAIRARRRSARRRDVCVDSLRRRRLGPRTHAARLHGARCSAGCLSAASGWRRWVSTMLRGR